MRGLLRNTEAEYSVVGGCCRMIVQIFRLHRWFKHEHYGLKVLKVRPLTRRTHAIANAFPLLVTLRLAECRRTQKLPVLNLVIAL